MKLGKLLLLLSFFAFGLASCGDDEDDTPVCVECILAFTLFEDCEIEVCPDGTSTSNEAGTCGIAETNALALDNQQEIIDLLEGAVFTCN